MTKRRVATDLALAIREASAGQTFLPPPCENKKQQTSHLSEWTVVKNIFR